MPAQPSVRDRAPLGNTVGTQVWWIWKRIGLNQGFPALEARLKHLDLGEWEERGRRRDATEADEIMHGMEEVDRGNQRPPDEWRN